MNLLLKHQKSQAKNEIMDIQNFGIKEQKLQSEIIYNSKKPTHSAFYLLKGYVRLVNRKKGTTKTIAPGQFFGDRSIFYSKNIIAEALSNVEYVKINQEDYQQLFTQNIDLAVTITKELSQQYICKEERTSKISQYVTKLKSRFNGDTEQFNQECNCL